MISDDKKEVLIKAILAYIEEQELTNQVKKDREMPLWAPNPDADDSLEIDYYDPIELEHYKDIFY